MHLRKDITLMRLLGWDKGTDVHVSDLSVRFPPPLKEYAHIVWLKPDV